MLPKARGNAREASGKLIEEISGLQLKMEKNDQLFNLTEDETLLDAVIFEQKALQARYTYLLRLAREKNIKVDFIERL